MNATARTFALRLLGAAVVAAVGLYALHRGASASAAEAAAAAAAQAAQRRSESAPDPLEQLGFPLPASRAPILVASGLQALAPDAAPVVEVLGDGSLALRRPVTPFAGPLAPWRPAAIVVPSGRLAAWAPAARGAFTAAIGALAADRPVPAGQVQVVDAPIAAAELAALLTWVW
jgi:hypothetical protein